MRRGFKLVAVSLLTVCFMAPPIHADNQSVKNKGLYITPLRQYVSADAGEVQRGTFTVGNYTNNPVTMTYFAEQFLVTDYTYDLQFESPPKNDWVIFDSSQSTLNPYQSQVVHYSLRVPWDAGPGGHYFTLLAKTTIQNGSLTSNLQAASMLYLTVNGKLTRSSVIQKNGAPWIVFGGPVSYQLDIKNTGNTHFFVYTSGQLRGLGAKPREPARAHILLPGTVRTIRDSIDAPALPSLYQVTYGYTTDEGQTVERSSYLLYVPPWSILAPIGLCIIFWPLLHRRKRKTTGS